MDNEEKMQLALAEAKRRKISVNKLLRLDRKPCNCKRCKYQKDHPPDVIAQHLALYGTYKAGIDNSESALVDTAAGPSRQRSSSVRGSRGSRGTPQRSVPPRVSFSPAPVNASGRQNDAEMYIDGSSGQCSRSSSPNLVVHPPPPSPPALAQSPGNMDEPGAQSNQSNANVRTYRMARLGPAQPFDNGDHLRERIRNVFGREATPDAIVPNSPSRMKLPDPDSHVEDPGYIEPVRYRSVSAVPTLADAPPLRFVWAQSNSRPDSAAGDAGDNIDLENPMDDLEDGAYQELMNELDDLDIEPEGLDLDDANDLNDDENSVDDDFYARIDADPGHNPDTDDPGAEDNTENQEPEERERPPAFNDEPGADPDELEPADNAAMDEPDLLRNIYIRVWIESVFGGSTREQTRRTLLSHKSALEALVGNLAGELAEALTNALPTMATTFRALVRRLGINLDDQLVIYALCKSCGTRYTMEDVSEAEDPGCPYVRPGEDEPCGCPVWEERVLYGGTRTRLPFRSFPYFPLPAFLERILSRPGMRELIARLVLHDENNQPWSKEDWLDAMPINRKFSDIFEGYGRYSDPSGLERGLDEVTGVFGDAPGENGVRALASLPLGLSLAISIDGFNTLRRRGYTSTGVYIVINNLPSHLRSLIENMILVAVLPGPKEPTAYEFDQMLEPLINDLMELERDLVLRNTLRTLDEKVAWLNAPERRKEGIRQITGVTFTVFDRLPGWYPSTMCPTDIMHLIHLGTTKHIIKSIILLPGLMKPRPGTAQGDDPLSRADAFLDRLYLPSFCSRRIPNFERLTSGKAEQYRHVEVVLPVVLFIAWQDGNSIREGLHPRGATNTRCYKFQHSQADTLKKMRCKVHGYDQKPAAERPTIATCASVRSLRLIYGNVLRYCVGVKIVLARRIARSELSYATGLFSRVCDVFTRLNIPLPPNFHSLQHIEEGMTRFGASDQNSVWVFERAHRKLIRVNHNNHTQGTLETTMARGFVKTGMANSLVHKLQEIPNPTADDIHTINTVLGVMGNGPEHERQRGRLDAILAGDADFQDQERIILATTSSQVIWTKDDHNPYWDMVIDFCSHKLGIPVYGHGIPPPGGVCLEAKGSTRCFPYVRLAGIRFGNDYQMRGYTSRYGYIDEMVPALIKRIYQCSFNIGGEPDPRIVLCAVVQRFMEHEHEPDFPWMPYARRLQIQHWAYDSYNEPEVIAITSFSGSFALGDVVMSYGHYWITFAMKPVDPEYDDED
ncbi:hypothetical protein FRC07_011347 [Ceratobasidium sp. 392]|nr:hypothetical protein FRC07_011347 [Ceratobasidium sp. 392]